MTRRTTSLAPRVRAAVLVAWACALVGGCGGAAKMPEPTRDPALREQQRQEIAGLWSEIQELEASAGFESESYPPAAVDSDDSGDAGDGDVCAAVPMTSRTARAARPPARDEMCFSRDQDRDQRCTDVCRLAGSICDNAERICRIAGELGDDWARGRCTAASGSCRRADRRCCGCS
jgi:hypothetical protein